MLAMINNFGVLRDYLHDIHRLDEAGAKEGKYQRQVLKMSGDSPDQGGRGDEG